MLRVIQGGLAGVPNLSIDEWRRLSPGQQAILDLVNMSQGEADALLKRGVAVLVDEVLDRLCSATDNLAEHRRA
jgi:uncharacterized membrane-anchored protein